MDVKFLACLICVLVSVVSASNILMVFPLPSKSHYILGRSLASGLLNAGHDVTMITHSTDEPPKGKGTFRYVTILNCSPAEDPKRSFNYFDLAQMSPFLNLPMMNAFGQQCTKNAFEHENVKKLLQSNQKFDAVIAESLFTDGLSAFSCHYKAPLIVLSPVGTVQWVNNLVGNPTPPSYISSVFLPFIEMNFWQKSENAVMSILVYLNHKFINGPSHNKLVQEYFPGCPAVDDIKISLVLSNSHESFSPAAPHVPNIIDIGGFHITASEKKLPADLQKILDNAKLGVVYFSLGSHIKPSHMTPEVKRAIVNVFASLKQTVIWKWDTDSFPEKPDNVIVGKWFPQQEILAHPNTRLFITHAGLLSLAEAIHIGVPILAMPILGDQKLNAYRAEALGVGKRLFFSEVTEETFGSAVSELLSNPRYLENVKRRSAINRDRPQKPIDLAIYWIEYIIRHKGAPHLRVAGADLPWYQYFLVDVIAVWGVIFIILIHLVVIIIKKICCGKHKEIKSKTIKMN